MLGLRAQCYSILCLINLVVHLTCLVSTVDIHGTGSTGNFIVRVVMLHVHGVSAHGGLGLSLHVPLELVELLLVAAGLLMISMGWVARILARTTPIFRFFPFQIIVWQVTNLVLVLLLLVLWVRAVVVDVRARDHILGVLNEILIARWVGCVLRWRSYVRLILISLDILRQWWLVLRVRKEASGAAVFEVILVALLVWVLAGRGVRYLLRKEGHVVLSSVLVVLDLGHLVRAHLRLGLPSGVRPPARGAHVLTLTLVCRYLTIN